MSIHVEILSQGEELLTGQTVDTNAAWLSEQLVNLGFQLKRHTTVGDDKNDLVSVLTEIAARADCCLCTGGLGPTVDDLTAEAVAEAFAIPLVFDPEAYAQITEFFVHRQRAMPAANRKQALLPQGCMRLDNHWGTAPGFALYYRNCWFAFMPGVPYEMRNMFQTWVHPWLLHHFAPQPYQAIAFKTIGLGESAIQERVKHIPIPANVQFGFCAGEEDVKTKLRFPPAYPEAAKQALLAQFSAQLGESVYAIEGLDTSAIDLIGVVAALLQPQQQTVAVIETVTQGLIAAKCIAQPWLLQSSYQHSLAQITAAYAVIMQADALEQTARAVARTAQQRNGADLVLVQLYNSAADLSASPTTSITLYNALASADAVVSNTLTLAGSAKRIQNQAAMLGLDFLRRFLQHRLR